MNKIDISTEERGSFILINIEGEISERTIQKLNKAVFSQIEEQGHSHIVFDLSKCDYIDSTGIGIFIKAAKKVSGVGGKIGIIGANDSIKDVIDMSASSNLFKEYKDLEEAAENMDN